MKKSTVSRLGAIGVATALLTSACGASSSSDDGDSYKVGVAIALTGASATFGQAQQTTLEARVDAINEAGGIDGKNIELIIEDTKSDPTEATRVAADLIQAEKVMVLIGGSTSSETLAFLPTAARRGVAVLSLGSNPAIVDPEAEWFGTTLMIPHTIINDNDAVIPRMIADGVKSVGLISQEDEVSAAGVKDFQARASESGDIRVLAAVTAASTATDVSAQALRITRDDPDAIYMLANGADLQGAILRAIRDAGYDGPIYATAGVVQSAVIDVAGPAAEGTVSAALINPDDPSSRLKLQELMQPLGGIKNHGNFNAAQAVAVLEAGLADAPTTGAEFVENVEKIGSIEGFASAPLQYSATNHVGLGADGLILVTVENGKFVTTQ
ncbi:ABC transporter substrate-binding protein [Rhodococcus sp. NPDC019627]|uniref:ABC transporter substrate-binding protein n=1 Tax=unclassified Rhodococcus (in: high G+C Gram-positive bacteria) TaxID=192944 RepID=UPI0034083D33